MNENDAVIELDLSTPWEPPSGPPVRGIGRPARGRRWLAVLLVAAAVLGLLVAAVPLRGDGPAFGIDHQILSVNAAGGRLFIGRYKAVGTGPQLEAHSLRDGSLLWSAATNLNQHFAFATDRVLALTTEYGDQGAASSTVTVIDAVTGTQLWHRDSARIGGRAGGRIVLADLSGVPDQDPVGAPPAVADLTVNRAPEQRAVRYVGLDERTGATAWTVDVPAGSMADFTWDFADYYRLVSFTVLGPTGLLQTRDLGTGAVVERHQLDWSGTISRFTTGDVFGAGWEGPDQVIVSTAGQRGADVFDRRTGARLWHWEGDLYAGLFVCAPDRYCTTSEAGTDSVDARTGRPAWHIDRYDNVLRLDGRTMVLGIVPQNQNDDGAVVVVDARTGGPQWRLDGWRALWNLADDRVIVWQPVDEAHAVLGTLDPENGRVTVFGHAEGWFGQPECAVDAGSVACLVVGTLSVWRLPPAPAA